MMKTFKSAGVLAVAIACGACGGRKGDSVPASLAADAIAQTVAAHRLSYAKTVVERLTKDGAISADEDYERKKLLPLPAQFLRMSSEHVARSPVGQKATFALISADAINKVNKPRSDVEKEGLKSLAANPDQPYRTTTTTGGKKYYSALYADKAVTAACVDCHNKHPDSPRHDWKVGDTMGALVVSVALED